MYWIHVGENESGKRGQELVSGEYLMARSKLHELKKGVPPPTAVAGGSISATRLSELADAHSKIASGHKEVGTLGRPTWHAQEAAKHEGYSNELRQMARSREEKTTGKLADNKVYEVSTKVGGKTVSMTLTGAYIKARDAVEAHGPTVRMFPIASNEEAMMRHSKSWLTKASEVNAHHADLHAAAAAHGRADYHQPKVEAFRAKSNYLKSLAEKRVDLKAPYKSKHRHGQDQSMSMTTDGEGPGHVFRGNQYVVGQGGGLHMSVAPTQRGAVITAAQSKEMQKIATHDETAQALSMTQEQ
jgi:hypothetical protein